MSALRTICLSAVFALPLLQLQGCAIQKFPPAAPAQKQPIAVQISGEDLAVWGDLPPGVYRIPGSQVVISGHQKGMNTVGGFGLIALAVAHEVNASTGASRVHDVEGALRIKLNDRIMATVSQVIGTEGLDKTFSGNDAGPKLTLTPALILTYVSDTELRADIAIRANLTDSFDREVWKARYNASAGGPRPLAGADGWTDNEDAALNAAIKSSLEELIRVMLIDVSHPFPRDDANLVTVEGNFPLIKERVRVVGCKLLEDDHYLILAVHADEGRAYGLAVLKGLKDVHVLDKGVITYRSATPDDRTKVLD